MNTKRKLMSILIICIIILTYEIKDCISACNPIETVNEWLLAIKNNDYKKYALLLQNRNSEILSIKNSTPAFDREQRLNNYIESQKKNFEEAKRMAFSPDKPCIEGVISKGASWNIIESSYDSGTKIINVFVELIPAQKIDWKRIDRIELSNDGCLIVYAHLYK